MFELAVLTDFGKFASWLL